MYGGQFLVRSFSSSPIPSLVEKSVGRQKASFICCQVAVSLFSVRWYGCPVVSGCYVRLCGTPLNSLTLIVRQSECHFFVADATTLSGVKTEMPALERVPHGFWRILVVSLQMDDIALSLCVATHALQ